MPRDLTAAEVAALSKEGTHRVSRSLYLQIRGGNRSWLFRYRFRRKPKWMSVGPAWLLTLTEAKRKVLAAQKLLLDGIDPLEARRAEKRPSDVTFSDCVDAYLAAHEASWANPKHRYQWRQSLETYAYPVIGHLPVDRIDANHVVGILEPIWLTKTETAKRLRGRIERILDWAKVAGHRSGENPARWVGHLAHRLPSPKKIQKVVHHAAVPHAEAPAVYARLNEKPMNSARLLQFIMLTAIRFGEAAKATWAEMNIEAEVPVFTIPAERMKMRRLHRVPLSQPAIEILRGLRREKDKPGDLVFNGQVRGKTISDTTVRKLLRNVGPDDAQTHGLRSTFRDWAADHGYDRDVAEAALAHSLGDDVTLAYLRSDLFQRRVKLMEDWGEYLTGG